MKIVENFINGKLQSSSQKYLDIYDPSTGEVISKVVLSEKIDFNMAIESSKKAQF